MPFRRLISALRRPNPVPPPPDLSEYASLCERSLARLKEWAALPAGSPNGQEVAVLVAPWVQSAVPQFALEAACMLREAGCGVTLLYDSAIYPFNSNDRTKREVEILSAWIAEVGQSFPVIRVPEQAQATSPVCERATLRELLWENFVWLWKREEHAADHLEKNPQILQQAVEHAARIVSSLRQAAPDWVFIPGGVFGVSGLYVEACRRLDLDFTTYDSGPEVLAICHRDVTGFHTDVAVGLDRIREIYAPAFLESLGERGAARVRDKVAGNDPQKMQIKPADQSEVPDCDVLLCLNRRADTAAMMRARAFDSVRDWIEGVCRWFVARGQGRLIIRQHPIERWERFNNHDDYAAWVRAIDPEEKFVTFIPADSEVNTYSLIAKSKVVLPFTSRTGIEAILLDRPVVLGAKSFFLNQGFGWSAATGEEYFSLVEEGLSGRLLVTDEQKIQAGLVYLVFGTCEWMPTPFNARPEDFEIWVKTPARELWASPILQDLRDCLLSREPMPLRRFRRLYGEPESASLPSLS